MLFCGFQLLAQSNRYNKAIELYNNYDYSNAVQLLEDELEIEPNSTELLYYLARSYYKMCEYQSSLKYYDKLFTFNITEPQIYLEYGNVLRINQQYYKAKSFYNRYLQLGGNEKLGAKMIASCKSINSLSVNKENLSVFNLNINSKGNDFSAILHNKELLFCSSGIGSGGQYGWDNQKHIDIFRAFDNQLGIYTNPESFDQKINSNTHEGPFCFSGDTILFTRTVKKTDAYKQRPLSIFYAVNDGKSWSKPKPYLPIIQLQLYSVGHPTISPSGNTLVFAAKATATSVESNLYVAQKIKGNWSVPVLFSTKLNTLGNELFPYLYNDSTLYFASDAHIGLGGLDIYKALIKGKKVVQISNLGAPINSSYDDFGYFKSFDDDNSGFFTSNRKGGAGADDLYSFRNIKYLLNGNIVDAKNEQAINGATVLVRNSKGILLYNKVIEGASFYVNVLSDESYRIAVQKEGYNANEVFIKIPKVDVDSDTSINIALVAGSQQFATGLVLDEMSKKPIPNTLLKYLVNKDTIQAVTNSEGRFKILLPQNKELPLHLSNDDYFSKKLIIPTDEKERESSLNPIYLQPYQINSKIEINPIYYDFDEFALTKQALQILDELLALMQANPALVVELSSHTDARGSDEYNQDLSYKRAKVVIDYLQSKGIENYRLQYQYYGYKMPAIPCTQPLKDCPESIHKMNRRTEFRVRSY